MNNERLEAFKKLMSENMSMIDVNWDEAESYTLAATKELKERQENTIIALEHMHNKLSSYKTIEEALTDLEGELMIAYAGEHTFNTMISVKEITEGAHPN